MWSFYVETSLLGLRQLTVTLWWARCRLLRQWSARASPWINNSTFIWRQHEYSFAATVLLRCDLRGRLQGSASQLYFGGSNESFLRVDVEVSSSREMKCLLDRAWENLYWVDLDFRGLAATCGNFSRFDEVGGWGKEYEEQFFCCFELYLLPPTSKRSFKPTGLCLHRVHCCFLVHSVCDHHFLPRHVIFIITNAIGIHTHAYIYCCTLSPCRVYLKQKPMSRDFGMDS